MHAALQQVLSWQAHVWQSLRQFDAGNLSFLLPLLSGFCGAILGSTMTWFVGVRGRRQNYYIALVRNLVDHNWSSLREKTGSGLGISTAQEKICTVCYQHINLLFFAWLHHDIIRRDGSLDGWKHWAQTIVVGAQCSENDCFRAAYCDILTHGDIYPVKFLEWLDKTLGMSKERFAPRPVSSRADKTIAPEAAIAAANAK